MRLTLPTRLILTTGSSLLIKFALQCFYVKQLSLKFFIWLTVKLQQKLWSRWSWCFFCKNWSDGDRSYNPILFILYNACFKFGVFSSNLKIPKIIPVFKSGDKTHVTNYKPISILSCFSKIFEKAVYNRTINFLNDHSVLSPTQYGFRSNFSTEHAVLDIVNTCYDNIERKMYSGLVLLDLAKPFDTVNHHILLQKLEHYKIRGIVLQFFQSFLENRKQFVCINKLCSTLTDVNIGVPQGSTLGPLLFLLYINDLPNSANSVPRLFADDTCLLVNSSSTDHL